MNPLKQYAYIWRFNDEREKAYQEFNLSINSISLRVVNILIIIGMASFVFVDIFRPVNHSFVLTSRIVLAFAAGTVMMFSWRKKLSPTRVDWLLTSSLVALAIFAVVTARFGNMPFFFLPNISITIMVFVATISGLRLRYSLLFNFLYLAFYIIYSQAIQRDAFLLSQTPNLVSMFVYSSLAGVLIEIRRRRNFMQYEDIVRQKREIERLNLQQNKIISLLSHDVASPLNSLSGLLQLQMNGQVSDQDIKPFLRQVGQRLKGVSSLLYGLVRWSKSQLHGFVLQRSEVELVNLINEVAELFLPIARGKSINLHISASNQVIVNVDVEMIKVVFRNLISNAVKFALRETVVDVNFVQDNESHITVKVSNTGRAIPGDMRKNIFDFHMTSATGTAGEVGTGLGLVMAAQFVKMNNGSIYLERSDPMGQTVFCVTLPVERIKQTLKDS